MGDRTGLPKLDRTNGYEDGRNYMTVKKSKLAEQNDQLREALRRRNTILRTDIFKDISINVNGRTQPTADELKRLILLNGGDYHPYYRYQTTKFMIATNLSMARVKQLRPDDRVVRPEWIVDSIRVKCLLPYEDYLLFPDHQLSITHDNSMPAQQLFNQSRSNTITSTSSSSSSNFRKSNSRKKTNEPIKNNRDIREMFTNTVRTVGTSCINRQS